MRSLNLTVVLWILALALPALSGCMVMHTHDRPTRTKHRAMRAAPECRPSHYWDGRVCRHKGKGKGARKHDYRGARPD